MTAFTPLLCDLTCLCNFIFSHVAAAHSGIGPPSFRGFTITLGHTTHGCTSLDE
jgi:hypothetical protein